jgi:CDP-diacylglycerol---glycerol-3-phosphate 3-phosphatidyltransferase
VTPPGSAPSVWNPANALTVLRLVLVPLFGWLLLRQSGTDEWSRIAAFVVFAVAMVTDKVDGDLARSRGWVTDFGKIADPIADKALIGTALVGLSLLDQLWWWVTVVILIREIGVTALRFVVIRYGVIPASRGGKTKTALQAIAISLYVLPLPSDLDPLRVVTMALAVVITLVTGLDYVLTAIRLRRTSRGAVVRRSQAENGG